MFHWCGGGFWMHERQKIKMYEMYEIKKTSTVWESGSSPNGTRVMATSC